MADQKIDVMRYKQINRFLIVIFVILSIVASVLFSVGSMKGEDVAKCQKIIKQYFNYFPQDVLELNKEIKCSINVLHNTCTCRINYIFDLSKIDLDKINYTVELGQEWY